MEETNWCSDFYSDIYFLRINIPRDSRILLLAQLIGNGLSVNVQFRGNRARNFKSALRYTLGRFEITLPITP